MNDLFATVGGLLTHSYVTAAQIVLIILPASFLFLGLRNRFDLR